MLVRKDELVSTNPATGALIESHVSDSSAEIDRKLDESVRAAEGWAATPPSGRAALLRSVAAVLLADLDRHAMTITVEMGKAITEARAEVEKCAFACDYFAEHAARFLADEPAPSDSPHSYIAFEPLGTVLACMPWNFPYWQVFRCAAPALAAGNCVALKHANNVTRCGRLIEEVFRTAGAPPGVFALVAVPIAAVAGLIADPRIAAVSLTGSTAAGRSVGETAGRNLKKCVLELGGSDAFIVLDDADLDRAAEIGARSRFQNAGQSCIAAKRFIVADTIAAAFEERLIAHAAAIALGDPSKETTAMGPMARADLRDSLERQMTASIGQGATLRTGGVRPDRPGFYLEPAVLTGCEPAMPVFREETFGPLAALARVRSDDEAVTVANSSPYGLGGNVWTNDVDRGLAVAARLRTGSVFVNGMTHSDPRVPFGGVRDSGYGRELHRFGIHEFVNIKTMWIPA
jgi:acyl-CoA reductase-like NAD-dependent aldehyde dehydrogenase